jgi:hypothetical protein
MANEIIDPQIPSAITRETLAKIPDDQLWYVLREYASERVIGDGKNWNTRLERLPRGLRMIYHLDTVDFEVPNGGFSQYFYNVDGRWVAEALDALHRIGARRRAELLERAIGLFESEVGRPRDYQDRWMGPWFDSPVLDDLDDQYPVIWSPEAVESFGPEYRQRYDREVAEEALKGFVRYVREHPEEFLHPER